MEKAFRVAKDGKPGAVHIDLPKDVLVNPTRMTNQTWKSSAPIPKSNVGSLKAQQIDMEMVQQAADMINNSEQPVIILGKGVNDYPDTVANLVEASGAPVTTTIHAMGVFDEAHPLSLQMMGMHGFASANYALQSADCIINIGSRFDDRTTGSIKFYAPEAKRAFDEHRGGIIHCNIEPSEINKVLDTHINFACDGQVFMDALIPLLQHKPRQPWLDQIAAWKADFPIVIDPAPDGQIKQQDVIKEINHQVLESGLWKRTLYTSGVGNHQMYAAQLIEWKIPKSFITSGSLGVMGAGLPYAIGAQIAHPDHVVIDIDGDSSFNHTLSELKTVAEYNLPIKVAVLNDGHQSMVRVWEELFFNARYTATACAKNPNYALLAESYGLKSLVCDNLEDLPAVVNEFLTCKEPVVCDFRVLTDRCLPLVAPGMALHDMILHESQATKTVEMDLSQPPS